ncbi:MAG: FAD:protein FMN transferase [Candidatus Latescibacterota bacterium]|nr:MAG: FAD:protein FMN transferase [Candidatus Latescibacterota bacterium]
MGTYVTITVVSESRHRAEEAIGRAFEEMTRLIDIFNRYDSSTPLSVLNQQGYLTGPPAELTDVVTRAIEICKLSHGAFDITVKPIVDLFKNHGDDRRPAPDDIDETLTLVGSDKIELAVDRIGFQRAGMGMTLDGIAKGYIVDRISDVLVSHGVDNHLINAGGDIRARGARQDKRPWAVAIQDPQKKGNYPQVVRLTDGAVATSGSYEVYYDQQRILHHIIDPQIGTSPNHNVSVSVMSESVMQADALSTAVFVLRQTAGKRLIESMPNSSSLVIDSNLTQYRSDGWPSTHDEMS